MLALKILLGLLLTSVLAVQADDVVIQSFDTAGKIAFNEVPGATNYRVEWASTLTGPWTNFASASAALDHMTAAGSGVVTCAVPMVYRVVAWVTNPPPADMVLIPAGSFVMGNATNVFPASEGGGDELPQHAVQVSAFYMGKYEVTKALWDEVYAWAVVNGYQFDHAGSGKATNHPVQMVNWYEVVKWCNARSQKEGLTACYTTNGGVYRTGNYSPDCNWSATGYRLPTEAEWEKAARGGVANHRFPWSDADTLQHARANYYCWQENGTNHYVYDTSPTAGYHPAYTNGALPYTSPVGSFTGNGYGLADMAGNVCEWCWDWYGSTYYDGSPTDNPRGPSTGSNRMSRGGGWNRYAYYIRVADRDNTNPDYAYDNIGFRVVRSASP